MDLRRLLQPLLLFGAFSLGLVLGFALFAWIGGRLAGDSVQPFLLLSSILSLGFGLVGLTVGAVPLARDPSGSQAEVGGRSARDGLRITVPMNERSVHEGPADDRYQARDRPAPPDLSSGRVQQPRRSSSRERRDEDERGGEEVSLAPEMPASPHYSRGDGSVDLSTFGRGRDTGPRGSAPYDTRESRRGDVAFQGSLEPVDPAGLRPEDLIRAWETYEAEGGHFTASGLTRCLESAGLQARTLTGQELGAGDAILGVTAVLGNGPIYLLPDFNRPSSAVSQWFEDQGSSVRTAYIKRLIQVAEAVLQGGELSVRRKGVVA